MGDPPVGESPMLEQLGYKPWNDGARIMCNAGPQACEYLHKQICPVNLGQSGKLSANCTMALLDCESRIWLDYDTLSKRHFTGIMLFFSSVAWNAILNEGNCVVLRTFTT